MYFLRSSLHTLIFHQSYQKEKGTVTLFLSDRSGNCPHIGTKTRTVPSRIGPRLEFAKIKNFNYNISVLNDTHEDTPNQVWSHNS
jgi:hypothetical protein